MSGLSVAVIQFCPGIDRQANLDAAAVLLADAAAKGAAIAVLPEMFSLFVPADQWRRVSEPPGGPAEEFLSKAAAKMNMNIIGGSYLERDGRGRLYNTCPVVSRRGKVLARYRKMHLFWTDIPGSTAYDERSYLTPGNQQLVVDLEGLRVAVGICYDVRFPEFFRLPGGRPVDMYCLPSAFMHATGEAHWDVLIRSRAVENLAYVAAAGTVGCHYEIQGRPGESVNTYGHSMIVSPWGKVLAEVPSGHGFALAEVSREEIADCRLRLGALDHIRGDLWPRPK